MPSKLYFAYGSNLNREDWRQRTGFSPDVLKDRSTAYLPDHDVRFSYDSKRRDGGVLDVQPRVGQVVPGVVFEVDDCGWQVLDDKEGEPYERIGVTVLDKHGREMAVDTYRVRDEYRRQFVVPSVDYLDVVRAGLEFHGLPTRAVEAAAKNEHAPLVDAFFVYGTLMRREFRFSALQSHGVRCALLAKAFGRLLDIGEYPALIDMDSTDSMVHGDFVRVTALESAIQHLDGIEVFRGFGLPGSLYRRTLSLVDVGEGRIRHAWTYCWARSHAGTSIASGDWRQHHGRRDDFITELARVHARDNERETAMGIANTVPFNLNSDTAAVAQSLLPLHTALGTGHISERLLAQQSGIWTALA